MAQDDPTDELFDNLDAFFDAAESKNPEDVRIAAENVVRTTDQTDPEPEEKHGRTVRIDVPDAAPASANRHTRIVATPDNPQEGEPDDEPFRDIDNQDLEGKFVAIDPDAIPGNRSQGRDPFVLIPANIHSFVPWWGWLTIVLGLAVLVTAVVLLPGVSLNRTVARLGDSNPATAQNAMRQLVMKGDERTVDKLYSLASSPRESVHARLRAVDTMSLIERVPAVDRALLRLELSSATNEQVREVAIAARKQREAYKTRGRR